MEILDPSRSNDQTQAHSTANAAVDAPAWADAHPSPSAATGPQETQHHGIESADLIRIAFVALAAAAVWFRVWEPLPKLRLIGGYPIFKEVVENIFQRRMAWSFP